MDDRFRTEGAENNQGSDYSGRAPSLGDFSVNIDSKAGSSAGFPLTTSKPKKFEVHIPDIDTVPSERTAEPGQRRPSAQPGASQARKPVQGQTAPRRPAQGQPARRPTPNGRTAPQKRSVSAAQNGKRPAATSASGKKAPQKKTVSKKPVSAAEQKRRSSRKYTFVKGMLITCVCLIFISIITVAVSTVALSFINDILVIDSDSEYSVTVEIPEGADYEQVFDILYENGMIKQKFLTDFFCRFRHYDEVQVKNKETGLYEMKKIEYQPGVYYLDADAGIETMLETIMVRNNYAKDTIRLTFPEGWSIAQVFEKIEKYKVCEAEKLYANLEIIGQQYGFISDIPTVSGRYLKAEGYLFPDTYDFFIGENASSVIKKLFNNFDARWTAEYNTRLKELGMTKDQIITIASIIQREAKDGTQMADISSVIHNRLDDAATFPNLEMNSTKDYISSLKEYNLFSDVYYSLYLEKYNTYSQPGLPPGPICNPGKSAIEAALYPADTNYLFFCHDIKTGEIYLAETADEHHANTAKVLYGNIGV